MSGSIVEQLGALNLSIQTSFHLPTQLTAQGSSNIFVLNQVRAIGTNFKNIICTFAGANPVKLLTP